MKRRIFRYWFLLGEEERKDRYDEDEDRSSIDNNSNESFSYLSESSQDREGEEKHGCKSSSAANDSDLRSDLGEESKDENLENDEKIDNENEESTRSLDIREEDHGSNESLDDEEDGASEDDAQEIEVAGSEESHVGHGNGMDDSGEVGEENEESEDDFQVSENESYEDGSESENYDENGEDHYSNDYEESEDMFLEEDYQYNTDKVVQLGTSSINVLGKYFDYAIQYLAEDRVNDLLPVNGNYINVRKLIMRRYRKDSLRNYYFEKVRERIVLIIDTSGSMEWFSGILNYLFYSALRRGDVEIYEAPNGEIEYYYDRYGNAVRVDHDNVMRKLRNRIIIYVGDYDGADTPVVLSWRNTVYWICNEIRYRYFREHDWTNYDEDDFKGVFIRVADLGHVKKALKLFIKYRHCRGKFIELAHVLDENDI